MQDEKDIASIIASDFGANASYVEDLLRQFQHNPASVGEEWSEYFQAIAKAEVKSELAPEPQYHAVNGGVAKTAVTLQPDATTQADAQPATPAATVAAEPLTGAAATGSTPISGGI